jgi:hypothetical protein
LGDNPHDLARFFLVMIHPGPHENAGRTKPSSGRTGEGRPHPEPARLITGRAHHTALGRRRAHDDGFAAQSRVIPLLHGSIEGIHIEMENHAKHRREKLTRSRRAVKPTMPTIWKRPEEQDGGAWMRFEGEPVWRLILETAFPL